MYVLPIQISAQAAVRHECMSSAFLSLQIYALTILSPDVAVISSLFYCCNCIGGALGNAIAGAIWNMVLPSQLAFTLADTGAAQSAFEDPFTYVASYAPGSHQRAAVSES